MVTDVVTPPLYTCAQMDTENTCSDEVVGAQATYANVFFELLVP